MSNHITASSGHVKEILPAIISAAGAMVSSNFSAGENHAYADGLNKVAEILKKDFPVIEGSVYYEFQCNPNRMGSAKLVVQISSLEIEIFSIFFDAFTSPGCYGNCGEYVNQEILRPVFDFMHKIKSKKISLAG